ncbi:hypothetical protein BP5796_09416 [Coleophoma crateriformis]|uniref:Uncharacterized protein n=1 Tax=Coleophoma crateriformis TaxID=565419 RepID=A0A3D8QY12_9HELO|nr:hypothetical protein BP5796_09416 [Coleophoma crateriformis]
MAAPRAAPPRSRSGCLAGVATLSTSTDRDNVSEKESIVKHAPSDGRPCDDSSNASGASTRVPAKLNGGLGEYSTTEHWDQQEDPTVKTSRSSTAPPSFQSSQKSKPLPIMLIHHSPTHTCLPLSLPNSGVPANADSGQEPKARKQPKKRKGKEAEEKNTAE